MNQASEFELDGVQETLIFIERLRVPASVDHFDPLFGGLYLFRCVL